MFFTYYQNNAGGSFINDDTLTEYVIIEAHDAGHADYIAESVGIDFEDECECCGSRWSSAEYSDSSDTPQIYGRPINETSSYYSKQCVVYHLNGTKELCPLKV